MAERNPTATEPTGDRMPDPPPSPPARPVAVEVRDLRKTFRVPTTRIDTLKERLTEAFRRPESRELTALRGISFDILEGEFFGVVGRNGSGKSTLLKLLASIYRADAGTIRVAGNLAPCIELGVGFNPELTAHENVVLNGVMMGLTPAEARQRFDQIIEFAELEEFTELKLKNYSSGMLVRLGFSLMTHVDADVLLVDEVLAVGDASFQQKCFDVFSQLHRERKTIVLVTHDMSTVEKRCDRAMLLEDGRIEALGDPGDVARRYFELNFDPRRNGPEGDAAIEEHALGAKLTHTVLSHESGDTNRGYALGEAIVLEMEVEAQGRLEKPAFGFQIVNADGLVVFSSPPCPIDGREELVPGERARARVRIDNRLADGHYYVHCALGAGRDGLRPAAFRKNAADFIVYGTQTFGGVVALGFEIETSAGAQP